jgi:hypothetical protein
MLMFIAIIAIAVLLYFNNSVKNRKIDRSNRLTEKHEALIQMLKEKNARKDDPEKTESDSPLP